MTTRTTLDKIELFAQYYKELAKQYYQIEYGEVLFFPDSVLSEDKSFIYGYTTHIQLS